MTLDSIALLWVLLQVVVKLAVVTVPMTSLLPHCTVVEAETAAVADATAKKRACIDVGLGVLNLNNDDGELFLLR